MAQMGDCCAKCGVDKHTKRLEFDCIVSVQGIDQAHWKKWETSRRIAFYKIQYTLDNIQLLCRKCHNQKTHSQADKWVTPPYEPTLDEDTQLTPQPKEIDPF